MKVIALASGLGTRLSEETQVRPKLMAEIVEHPMLWHIMKGYRRQGFTEFVICLGCKGYLIKEYFARYFLRNVRGRRVPGQALEMTAPEIVFHLAAQPLIRHSYAEPHLTYETNAQTSS